MKKVIIFFTLISSTFISSCVKNTEDQMECHAIHKYEGETAYSRCLKRKAEKRQVLKEKEKKEKTRLN